MHSVSRRLSFRALVRALHSRSLSRWTCRVTALLVMLVVALTGGLALAQTPPPSPQEPPSAPGTPGAPAQPAAPEQPAILGMTIKGDMAAWAEIEAALKKLKSLSGYRQKSSGVGVWGDRSVTTSEVIPPNSTHTITESVSYSARTPFGTTTFPAGVAESVNVNGQVRWRHKDEGKPWGPWECSKARPPADTRSPSIQTTVEVSREPDTEIEGKPVRTYVYTFVSVTTLPDKRQSTATGKITLYVDTQTGLPRREVEVITITLGSDNRELPRTTDYYDYDAKIEITLPPCEKEI